MTLHSRHLVGNCALRSFLLALCWLTGGALLFSGEGRPVQRTPAGQHSPAAATPLIGAGHGSPTAQARVAASYYKSPLSFERNQGQTDSRVKFLSRGHGYGLFLTGEEAVLSLRKPSASSGPRVETRNSKLENRNSAPQTRVTSPESRVPSPEPRVALWQAQGPERKPRGERSRGASPEPRVSSLLRLRLAGANPAAKVVGLDELPGKSNYFLGNDPKKWRTNVPNYGKVKYEGVYPGIDLVYYGNQRQLEYDFVVAPGADPAAIQLEVVGEGSALPRAARGRPYIDPNGDLVISAAGGEVRFRKPVIYQEQSRVDNRESRATINEANPKSKIQNRKLVDGGYKLLAGKQVRFEIAAYDHSRPLIIDPTLSYATFLGGTGSDYAVAIAVDSNDNIYVTGHTASTDFPTVSALYGTLTGPGDVFVTKMKADGTAPIYSTYLGGSYDDYGAGIAVDSTGNAYVTGFTYSTNFPTMNPFQGTAGGAADVADAFVTKLNPLGTALVYSSYLGGTSSDVAYGIALDSVGSAYIVGSTQSTNFPTMNPMQASNAGLEDAFVTKVRFDGGAKIYSTYLGGSGFDYGYAIAVDSGGNVCVTGSTDSTNFPTTNPFQDANGGTTNAFITKLDGGGGRVYSTYLGGSDADYGTAIAVDSAYNAYVVGNVTSLNFPVVNLFQPGPGGGQDIFVSKIKADGSGQDYTVILGGSGTDSVMAGGAGVAVDTNGSVYVTGYTDSSDYPLASPLQSSPGGGFCGTEVVTPCPDIAVSKINPAGNALIFSTYLGAYGADSGWAIRLDSTGNAYVAGWTGATDFPATADAYQPTCGGGGLVPCDDAVVAKFTDLVLPVFFANPASLDFGSVGVGFTSTKPVIVENRGDKNLFISSFTGSTGFAATQGAGQPCFALAPGTTCTIDVTFAPSAIGSFSGSLTIYDDAYLSPHVVTLGGTGTAPPVGVVVMLAPTSLSFGSQFVGTTSAAKTVEYGLLTGTVLNVASIDTSGDFTQMNNCPSSISAGLTCTISVTFAPSSLGNLGGTLTITDDGPYSPRIVTLTGTGSVYPVPHINQPIVPTSTPAGGPGFDLTVNGSGFVPESVINWNGSARPTTFVSGTQLTAAIPAADIPSPGSALITVVNPNAVPSASNAGLLLITSPTASVGFGVTPLATGGIGPKDVQVADLNHDGKADIVALNAQDNSFSYFQGLGNGSFAPPVKFDMSTTAGALPYSIAIADFNADGNLDIAVLHGYQTTPQGFGNTVSVHLGDGTGNFAIPGTVFNTGGSDTGVATGDFNEDGKVDLAIGACDQGSVFIHFGNGDGTFTQGGQFYVGACSAGWNAMPVAVADLNKDGHLDVIGGAHGSQQIAILLGDGQGNFTGPSYLTSLGSVGDIAPADYNGDGNTDLALRISNAVSILLGKGDGTFQPPLSVSIPYFSTVVKSGDFNGDNILDLAVNNWNGNAAAVLLGNGDGTFQPLVDFTAGTNPQALAIADLNGDGRLDIATADNQSNTVSVLLQTPIAFSARSLTFVSQPVGSTSSPQTVSLTNIGPSTLNISNIGAPADFPQTNGCIPVGAPSGSLATGSSCQISVTFAPAIAGSLEGTLSITTDAPGSPHVIKLTGTGIQPGVSLSPTGVSFTGNPLNMDCPTKTVTLTNTGDVPLSIVSITATAPFSVTNTCSGEWGAEESCSGIQVKFSPTEVGAATGTLTVTTNPPVTSGNTVSLSGNGLPACQLLAQVRSMAVLRGTEATDFEIADSKPSCSPVNLNLSCTPDHPAQCALNPTVIPPSGMSRLTVGNLRAVAADAVRVVVNSVSEFRAASEAVNVLFSDFAFTRAPGAASVRAGETASYALTIRPINGLAGPVALACNGAPRGASCTVTPAAVTLDGASLVPVQLQVATTARAAAGPSARFHWPPLGREPGVLLLVGLAILVVAASRRRMISPAGTPALKSVLLAALLLMLLWAACGGGGFVSGTSRGTPAGTYSLKVTGTYTNSSGSTPGSLTNSTTVTLQVN